MGKYSRKSEMLGWCLPSVEEVLGLIPHKTGHSGPGLPGYIVTQTASCYQERMLSCCVIWVHQWCCDAFVIPSGYLERYSLKPCFVSFGKMGCIVLVVVDFFRVVMKGLCLAFHPICNFWGHWEGLIAAMDLLLGKVLVVWSCCS